MEEYLILKYLKGELSEAESLELEKWVHSGDENKKLFSEIKNTWTASGLINAKSEAGETDAAFELFNFRSKVGNKNHHPGISVWLWRAAVILLLLGIGILISYDNLNKQKAQYNELKTKRGEKSFLKLADGTKIWLNSETTLRYPVDMNTKKVEVYLTGEAYFNVTKNHGRQFIVKTSDLDIAVLGTSFNVKSYSNDGTIETTLEEGKISITGKIGNAHIKEPVILKPDQQATFVIDEKKYVVSNVPSKHQDSTTGTHTDESSLKKTKKAPRLVFTEKVDTEIYSAWKDGMLTFKSEKLQDLAVRMERWYDVKIQIRDNDLRNVKYTGTFEKETVEQAFKALSLSYSFNYKINHDTIIVSKAHDK